MARPIKKIKLDGEQIEKLASLGHSDEVIAVLAGCQESTLHRRFATHLRMGRANLHHQIRTLQLEKAKAKITAPGDGRKAEMQVTPLAGMRGTEKTEEKAGDLKREHYWNESAPAAK